MADEKEYRSQEGRERLRGLAASVERVQAGLGEIVRFYSSKTPTSDRDEAEYRDGLKRKLRAQRDAINGFLDTL